MAQDPNVLVIPSGPQYFTAPNGTLAPTVGDPLTGTPGVPVNLTGVPLFAAPKRSGNSASVDSAGVPGPNDVVVSGLYNINYPGFPSDVGAVLVLANTQVTTPGQPAPNTGFFIITAVIDSHTVEATKVLPVPPSPIPDDVANGQIAWVVFRQDEFPAGDPLTYCAELGLTLQINTPASGPARFAAYNPDAPAVGSPTMPLVVNDSAGLFGKVQKT